MIVSRTIAKRRIAAGVRPGWAAAWGLVALDFGLIGAVLAALWSPVLALVGGAATPLWATFAVLFLVFFLPLQGVVILSSLWATKSRWLDRDQV